MELAYSSSALSKAPREPARTAAATWKQGRVRSRRERRTRERPAIRRPALRGPARGEQTDFRAARSSVLHARHLGCELDCAVGSQSSELEDLQATWVTHRSNGNNKILQIFYVLLALSVIISLFGMVNALVLSVFERTRELGRLRAVRMTRRQTRRMVRHECIITALIGSCLDSPWHHHRRGHHPRAARRRRRVLAVRRQPDRPGPRRRRGRGDRSRAARTTSVATEHAPGSPVRVAVSSTVIIAQLCRPSTAACLSRARQARPAAALGDYWCGTPRGCGWGFDTLER